LPVKTRGIPHLAKNERDVGHPFFAGPSRTLMEKRKAIMLKCSDSLPVADNSATHTVAIRVVETVVAGLLILMMAA
jgi:hypothetical protein